MKRRFKVFTAILSAVTLLLVNNITVGAQPTKLKLGNELLVTKYRHLLTGKRVGLVTNQSGVNSKGQSTINILFNDKDWQLVALYGPEHGVDGTAPAGAYVESYTHPALGIPVYSLYGPTRMPTEEMLRNVDVLVFDIQDIGARTYTYMSTLNYCMVASKQLNKDIIVLDRPNPLGGEIVDGPVLEDPYKTFVGVDNLPMAHGMTAGELALFFNRNIGAKLKVIPMEGYHRKMIFQDTGLTWVQTSPNIPDILSVMGYMATGLGEGTGIYQADKFKWIGAKGIDALKFANLLNKAGLPGVTFIPEYRGEAGGVRLNIINPYTFNPAKTGIYALTYAHSLNNFKVPKSGQTIVMFDKIMGTNKIGQYLEQNLTPQQIEQKIAPSLNKFKEERKKYLIYGNLPFVDELIVVVNGIQVSFDSAPYIDSNSRMMVPLRAIGEGLGANVSWDEETRTVYISGRGKNIQFTIDKKEVLINGDLKLMDTSPVIKNSRTMVPLRYVGEYLGALVNWDGDLRSVTVNWIQ